MAREFETHFYVFFQFFLSVSSRNNNLLATVSSDVTG